MTAQVLLLVVASWFLLSVAFGLTVCRGISWARDTEPAEDPTAIPAQTAPETRPAVTLPTPRSAAVVERTALEAAAPAASGEPARAAEA